MLLGEATFHQFHGGVATNAGMLYTAKGAASFLVPAASWLQGYTGSWHAVFLVAATTNIAVAVTALLILKPLRAAQVVGVAAAPQVLPATES